MENFIEYFPKKEIEGNIEYMTAHHLPIQFGIHEPKEDRWSRLHLHKFFVEFFYVEKGYIDIEFTDRNFKLLDTKRVEAGDSFVMFPGTGHRVFLPKGCRVLEFHQGPFVDDKIFND